MFADDTTLYMVNSDLEVLLSLIKNEFMHVIEWVNFNQLIINFDKTNVMILTNKHIK